MRLAGRSVRKRTFAPQGKAQEYGGGEPLFSCGGGVVFCGAEEGVRAFLRSVPAGKPLFLADEGALGAWMPLAAVRGAVRLVLSSPDCLPLFAMPDGITCVLAAGGEEVMAAARCFAAVRRIPCALFPTDGRLDGTAEQRGAVLLGGERAVLPLAEGRVVCDGALLSGSLARAYGRLLLSRLALAEARMLRILDGRALFEGHEAAFSALQPLLACGGEPAAEEIVSCNAKLRALEAQGLPAGEGAVLAKGYEARGCAVPEWGAFCSLLALYAAFCLRGKPRRYFVPDYRARAKEAGTAYAAQCVPSREQYAARALALEKGRGGLYAEIRPLLSHRNRFFRCVQLLSGGRAAEKTSFAPLLSLPEQGGGLSAIIRDFGLLPARRDDAL